MTLEFTNKKPQDYKYDCRCLKYSCDKVKISDGTEGKLVYLNDGTFYGTMIDRIEDCRFAATEILNKKIEKDD